MKKALSLLLALATLASGFAYAAPPDIRTMEVDYSQTPKPGAFVDYGNGVWVPVTPVPTHTAVPTATPAFTATPAPTATPVNTPVSTATAIATSTPASTATPIATATPGSFVPVGTILMTGGATADTNYLLCDSSAVSRTTYAALFARIGTTYGAGDGSTTFNVPELRQRFPLGKAGSGTGSTLGGSGGTIDHTHSVPAHYHGLGTGADLNITASGSHAHQLDIEDTAGLGTSTLGLTGSGSFNGRVEVAASNGINSHAATHTHAPGDFAGRIGLVTGGVDGNAAMTSGGSNPPYLVINYEIRAQ